MVFLTIFRCLQRNQYSFSDFQMSAAKALPASCASPFQARQLLVFLRGPGRHRCGKWPANNRAPCASAQRARNALPSWRTRGSCNLIFRKTLGQSLSLLQKPPPLLDEEPASVDAPKLEISFGRHATLCAHRLRVFASTLLPHRLP